MRKVFFILMALPSFVSCSDNEIFEDMRQTDQSGKSKVMTRIDGNCSIGNANEQFDFVSTDSGYITSVHAFGQVYKPRNNTMAMVQVWNTGLAKSTFHQAPYDSICMNATQDSLIAYTTITSANKSKFFVTDTYTTSDQRQSVRLNRVVVVKSKATRDEAFNSFVMISSDATQAYTANEYYMPGLIYRDGSNMNDTFIGATWTDDWILAREERMGLPFTMMRNKSSKVALSLCDYNLNPTTSSDDWGNNHLMGLAYKYASLGYNLEGKAPALTYCYPGCEGEKSYSDGWAYNTKTWSRRSTQMYKNTKQDFTIEVLATQNNDFAEAQRDHWRNAFYLYSPAELDVNSETVLDVSLQTLDHYWLKSGNAPGFPFSVYCSSGEVNETSFDMGFVGMQTACGYYLYRYGLDHGNETYRKKGEQILDFWANTSANADGMPKIWYDIAPYNSFRNYNDLRNMQGGMEPMLLAWSCAEAAHPGSHANWLKFCKGAADWMVSKQNSDGSFPKAFDNNGNIVDNGTYLTSNILRFLTAMYGVTSKTSYKTAITKAGNWCITNINNTYRYVGSVIDNPYVMDRESGQKMIEAMLACYDLTGDSKYLKAAQQAAYYTVGYMYAYNIPWENGTTITMPWPKKKSTVGITIIATGHSGADCGFSYNSFEYLRLYNITGDEYFLKIARLLEKNTKQTMDYDGSLGYPYHGLQREAIRCVTHRGDGVALWLPWCTASALDPLFRMEDAYGKIGIDNIVGPSSTDGKRKMNKLDDSRYVRKLGVVRLPDGKHY